MSKDEPTIIDVGVVETRVAVRQPAAVAPGQTALATGQAGSEPQLPIRQAMPAMLRASSDAFGSAVGALLSDLDQLSAGMERMAWLGGTPSLLEDEQAYQQAVAQIRWWGEFLKGLPNPQLLSTKVRAAVKNAETARLRTRVLAREAALVEHRRLVGEQLDRSELSGGERFRLGKIYDDPDATEWWVDPDAVVQAALDQLLPPPEVVPIVAEDLGIMTNPSGFNAVSAMREHPELGGRAQAMDAAIAQVLRREFKLSKKDAAAHAPALTGIFWIAMRRAMSVGDRQLATSLQLMVGTTDRPIQEQFAEELLKSWLHYLEKLPLPKQRLSLGQRINKLLGRAPAPTNALPAPEPAKQIAAPRPRGLLGDSEER